MKNFLTLFICFIGFQLAAQDSDTASYWERGGVAKLNFNQITLTNWAAGGESSIMAAALFNYTVNYSKKRKSWETVFDFGYGITRNQGEKSRKTEDRIDIRSKYGYHIKKNWHYSALLNFKSQFDKGFNFPNDSTVVSRFFSPAFILLSAGWDYRPAKWFSVFLSPATGKFTFVMDQKLADDGAFGVKPAERDASGRIVEPGQNLRTEMGALVSARMKKDVFKNVNLQSRLDLFQSYTDSESRKHVDVNWETLLNLQANQWLSTSIFLHMIYDHDIIVNGKRGWQVKETLGISLNYSFK